MRKRTSPNLELLYETHIETVFRYFYYKCLNKSVAEDLTSESFMALAEKMRSEAHIDDPVKYLYGIMRNNWNKYLREKYNLSIVLSDSIEDIAESVAMETEEWESVSLEERAMKYINRLAPRQREVAFRKLILKDSNKQIADDLNTTRNNVKVTLRRALRTLERIIEVDALEDVL